MLSEEARELMRHLAVLAEQYEAVTSERAAHEAEAFRLRRDAQKINAERRERALAALAVKQEKSAVARTAKISRTTLDRWAAGQE